MNYEFHPVANLFPLMDGEAFSDFCKDIAEHGLLEPIWLYNGKIIDGRNRYRACLETGQPPVFRNWNGQGSLVEFIVSLNLHRRQLTPGQKAAIASDIRPILAEEAKERQRKAGAKNLDNYNKGVVPTQTQELDAAPMKGESAVQAAAIVGASPSRVYEFERIAKKSPEAAEAIREGKMSIAKGLQEIKPKSEPKKEETRKESPRQECTEAMQFAVMAIRQLTRMRKDDPQRVAALTRVKNYINEQLGE